MVDLLQWMMHMPVKVVVGNGCDAVNSKFKRDFSRVFLKGKEKLRHVYNNKCFNFTTNYYYY